MTLDVPLVPSTSFLIHLVFGYVIFNHVDPDFRVVFFSPAVSDGDSKSPRKIKISGDFTHELPGPRRAYRYQRARADTKSLVVRQECNLASALSFRTPSVAQPIHMVFPSLWCS